MAKEVQVPRPKVNHYTGQICKEVHYENPGDPKNSVVLGAYIHNEVIVKRNFEGPFLQIQEPSS